WHQPWRAHVDADLAIGTDVQLNHTAAGLNADLPLEGQALVHYEAGEAAGTVAALFDLGAVGVEDPVAKVHVRAARRLDDQQLIEAHAGVAVAPEFDVLGLDVGMLADQVEDHEVVAQAMHFGEAQ